MESELGHSCEYIFAEVFQTHRSEILNDCGKTIKHSRLHWVNVRNRRRSLFQSLAYFLIIRLLVQLKNTYGQKEGDRNFSQLFGSKTVTYYIKVQEVIDFKRRFYGLGPIWSRSVNKRNKAIPLFFADCRFVFFHQSQSICKAFWRLVFRLAVFHRLLYNLSVVYSYQSKNENPV